MYVLYKCKKYTLPKIENKLFNKGRHTVEIDFLSYKRVGFAFIFFTIEVHKQIQDKKMKKCSHDESP